MFRTLAIHIVACATLLACTGDPTVDGEGDPDETPSATPDWAPLVDPMLWQETRGDRDPLALHRGESILCPESAWYPELGGVEIETTACAYLSLSQPLDREIAEGDSLRLVAWWQTLVSVEPARAHLAVLVDDELLWDDHIEIPGPADIRELEFVAGSSFPAGAMITFHLHNHGYNTWILSELSARSAE